MRVLVSGIGRSATTLLYQQIAKCMLGKFENIRFRYEPYLWSIDVPYVKNQRFSTEQTSHFGIHTHKSCPIFLTGENPFHDLMLDDLFGAERRPNENCTPDAFLTKAIRGAGRLESYIKKFPDLKIVACLRNPLATINSSLGMFSLLGDEFHSSDGPRLHEELKAGRNPCVDTFDEQAAPTLLEYSIWWWRALTEETLRVAEKYPSNFWLFVNESYRLEPEQEMESLQRFLPFIDIEKFQIGVSENAGPSIKQNHLTAADIGLLFPHLQYYCDKVLAQHLSTDDVQQFRRKLLAGIAKSSYTPPVASDQLRKCGTITLRNLILSGGASRFVRTQTDETENQISLDSVVNNWCTGHRWCPVLESTFQPTVDSNKSFGCVITCYNNEDTIRDTLISALQQTRPFEKIVVVNDASTDNSMAAIEDLVENSATVDVLDLASNVGVSAARHFGILALETDFITHLDGDDCFWPSKNLHEAEIVLQDENAIAFSDILIVGKDRDIQVSTVPYVGNGESLCMKLLTRQDGVPRDMTFARHLYFDSGGYDLRLSLYEDLDFKFRLAANHCTNWRRSGAPFGTVYNRKNPSLSRNEGLRLPRALTAHFFRYVGKIGLLGLEAAEAYRELLRHYPTDWGELIFNRLQISSTEGIAQMSTSLLSRQLDVLDDVNYVNAVEKLCQSSTFDILIAPWEMRYGVDNKEGPFEGFAKEDLYWQVSKSCGFSIRSVGAARGVRGLLYLPHLTEQKLNVVVEQSGNVVQQTFELQGRVKDEAGNHQLQEVEIPIRLQAGETKVSCYAASHTEDRTRNLFCLFADWQLFN